MNLRQARRVWPFCTIFLWVVLLPGNSYELHAQMAVAKAALRASPETANALSNDAPQPAGESVEEKLAKAQAELEALDRIQPPNRRTAWSLEESLREHWLRRLVRLYEEQSSFTAELQAVKKRHLDLSIEARSWTGFDELRPYSILLSDKIRESIQVERAQIANAESALAALMQLAEEHRGSLRQFEESIRQLNEQLEGVVEQTNRKELSSRRELDRLRSQTTVASVAVLELEGQIRREQLASSRIHLALLERQLVIAKAGLVFTESDMRRIAEQLDAEQLHLERELTAAKARHADSVKARDMANEEWRQARGRNSGADLSRAEEVKDLRQTQLETADAAERSLQFMLQALISERVVWELRFAGYQNRNSETLQQTRRRVDQLHRRIDLWRTYYQQQLEAASSQIALQESKVVHMDETSALASLARERLANLRDRDDLMLRALRTIERGSRLVQRSEEDLLEAAHQLPFLGRVRSSFSSSKSWLASIWTLELFAAQDTIVVDGQAITGTRSVTLGKVISALLIVVVGYWLTGLVSRIIEPIAVRRLKIDVKQARLIRRWVRVALVSTLVLFSLIWVKIPLTVFAFAGGALMIALGFGLQTLLKNFVSGIIILFERPFRVGDVLDVAGQRGSVVSIGIRSSVLQLFDYTEMLIPNSTLLENSVTNWTYSNRKVRFTVRVGIAYGSDTRRVLQLLTEIVDRHGLIEKEPQPQVLFTDFGESALTFEVRYWTDVVKANAAQVASDLRQMIAITFAEQNVVIAFPQRDIHFDRSQPLEVRVLASGDSAREGNNSENRQPPSVIEKARP